MTHRWGDVVIITLGILLLTLAVDDVVSKSLTNRQHSSEFSPSEDERPEDDFLDSPETEQADSNPDLENSAPGGPWGLNLDFSWLFVCPECDFISKIGMQKVQHAQNEL